MADKQSQALKRLTKKLNALRKTLRADERNLLDRMVLGEEAAAEVVAHRVTSKVADKAVEVRAHRFASKAADKVSEVVPHQMKQKAGDVARPMIIINWATGNYVVADEGPEVEGHLLKEAVAMKVATKFAPKNMA